MNKRIVARWQTRGKDWLELYHDGAGYSYSGKSCGGTLGAQPDDTAAIAWMERPWGLFGAGPVTVHKADKPTMKRVK